MAFAFVMTLGLFSCKDKAAAPAGGNTDTAQVEAADKEEIPDLAKLVEKATAEGDKWDEAQWKDFIKQAMLSIKPMMVELSDLTKEMEKDPSKAVEVMAKMEGIQEKYADTEANMEKLEKILDSNPIAKKINEDEEWIKQVQEELGIPDVDL